MLEVKETDKAKSEWAASIVFAPNKDGLLRFCGNYCKVNAVKECDSYPMHRIHECIDSFGDELTFFTLDANLDYWKLRIEEAHRHKTASTSQLCMPRHTIQNLQCPWGLPTSHEGHFITSQKAVRLGAFRLYCHLFTSCGRRCPACLQSITTAAQSRPRVDPEKRQFFTEKIVYLENVIRPDWLELASRTKTRCTT